MSKKKVIRVILSSPGDVNEERKRVSKVINRINKSIADEKSFRLELFKWEEDAIPGLHRKGPQAIINKLMGMNKCDLWIGILWNRFGTPTMGALSGTHHEFKAAIKNWKRRHRPHIMLYHKTRKRKVKGIRGWIQASRVRRFIKKFPRKKGMMATYASVPEFEEALFEDLNTFVRNYKAINKDNKWAVRKLKFRKVALVGAVVACLIGLQSTGFDAFNDSGMLTELTSFLDRIKSLWG